LVDEKIVRVVGLSSAVLFDKDQPQNPINRRISIIVMNKKAEEAAQQDGGTVQLDAESGDVGATLGASGVPPTTPAVQELPPIQPVAH
jgi:chemotaxis protein MotB